MRSSLVEFYRMQRNIFGICPRSGELFRLSECKVYMRSKPKMDWLDEIDHESERLDQIEERLDDREEEIRELARVKGRRLAMKTVRLLDPIFTPRRLNPDDAKVLFHPVDYIVFKGMKLAQMKSVLFLDRAAKMRERRALQRSIEKAIEREQYEWLTIRIGEDGSIREHE